MKIEHETLSKHLTAKARPLSPWGFKLHHLTPKKKLNRSVTLLNGDTERNFGVEGGGEKDRRVNTEQNTLYYWTLPRLRLQYRGLNKTMR